MSSESSSDGTYSSDSESVSSASDISSIPSLTAASSSSGPLMKRKSAADANSGPSKKAAGKRPATSASRAAASATTPRQPHENGVITFIEVVDFKNHEHMRVDLGPGVNFLLGENGSGKSALLAAIKEPLPPAKRLTPREQAALSNRLYLSLDTEGRSLKERQQESAEKLQANASTRVTTPLK